MSGSSASDDGRELDEWIADYLEAEETGQPLDTEAWLARGGKLQGAASNFLRLHERFSRLTSPLRGIATSSRQSPLTEASDGPVPVLPRAFGAFELLECLGQGGMGIVYKARQQSPNRLVAVKITRASLLSGAEDVRRFRNEAELVARLDHPGIVPIYEVGQCDGHLYYSMKLLPGGDLSRHLSRFRNEPRAAAELMIAVARAVHHAHQRGILHRDLKPSNILLDEEGKPHVTDFGLARRFEFTDQETADFGLTRSGELLGTPGYMAPEQTAGRGRLLTTTTDVYGLGAVFYALLTGRAPFRGETPMDTLLRVATSEPPSPRQLNPGLDRDVETICLKCLAREPARRYASAGDMAADLARWLSGEPIMARPTSQMERLWLYCRRQPIVASLSVVASLLLAALFVGLSSSVVMLRSEQARTEQQRLEAEQHAQAAQEREAAARQLLYVADINAAWRAFEASDQARMHELLARHTPQADQADLRGFEWHHLRHLADSRSVVTSYGQFHNGPIFCIAFSPDGQRLATASEDRTVAVEDAASRQRLFQLQGFSNDANWIVFTDDGQTLLACGEDGSIWRCDANTGDNAQQLYQTPNGSAIYQMALAPDGTLLAAACDDGSVRRLEYPSMRELPLLERVHVFNEWGGRAHCVRFTPDGETLLSSGSDATVKFWTPVSGELRKTLHFATNIRMLALARLATLAAAACDDTRVHVFDYHSGAPLHHLSGLTEHVLSVAISPDGELVAAADRNGAMRVWEAASGELLDAIHADNRALWSLTFTPDGKTLLAADARGHVSAWHLNASRFRPRLLKDAGALVQVQFLPDGQTAACLRRADSHVALLDVARGDHSEEVLTGHEPAAVVMAGDGRRWVVGCNDGTVKMRLRADERTQWSVQTPVKWIQNVAILPDGKTVISCGQFDRVRFWNADSGEALGEMTIDEQPALNFGLSSDGRALAIVTGQAVGVVDLLTRDIKLRVPRGSADFGAVALSSNAALLAVGRTDHSIELWETAGQSSPRILVGHTRAVAALHFSPDCRTLASAGTDGTVRLWSITLGHELLALRGADANFSVAFSPDGRWLLACGYGRSQGELFAWEAPLTSRTPHVMNPSNKR